MEKIIRLQDAKYKLIENNNNETSIFLDQSISNSLNLKDGESYNFIINKENLLKALCFTFSFPLKIFKKKDSIYLNDTWFENEYNNIINHFNISDNYKVKVSKATGGRHYLQSLKQESGLNIRNFLIQDYFKIIFSIEDKKLTLKYSFQPYSNESDDIINEPQTIYNISESISNKETINSINKIYYGAPGTGKSYKVKELTKIPEEQNRVERVTFHPEYDYSSFVGSYKPTMNGNNIRYEFIPQAFTNIYVKSWNDLENDYYLVIEEINRGNCAEIFGDIFQLLDRINDYKITPSKELKEYLITELEGNLNIDAEKLLLPPNLNILATMNTSDQSLFPMDSAFKRRWDWEYIPINYDETDKNASSKFNVKISETESFSWLKFIKAINLMIKENDSLGMDKCLGNYFIKPESNIIDLDTFINKAIFYLWNDVFKDEMEEDNIFKEKTSYEDFFPINIEGIKKVKEILVILGVDLNLTE
ncbi:AAA family ATPase [Tenacibaculum finnmarkense genomovar ulcerans]|uniref:AAA family ATPase n=1 Tax=Tenacibaculum finnmarkense TaxID=2781243 RepID=UPI001E618FF7|nr:AAA family ATPase [Tenacibaculum finnmarkense]MCD8431739.1 AAA family ATPase [Tenacibaculum finnmarkense genomovar ulcerans]